MLFRLISEFRRRVKFLVSILVFIFCVGDESGDCGGVDWGVAGPELLAGLLDDSSSLLGVLDSDEPDGIRALGFGA